MTTAREWLDVFARETGLEAVSDEDLTTLLDLAGVAAHASERIAAPVTCWMAAMAGLAPADALALATRLANADAG